MQWFWLWLIQWFFGPSPQENADALDGVQHVHASVQVVDRSRNRVKLHKHWVSEEVWPILGVRRWLRPPVRAETLSGHCC